MIHICYAYINHFKCLDNVGIKIDCRYDYHFDAEKRVLTIKKNERFPKGFWGKGVYSLSAIVGNNGAGKSTSLAFLLESLLEGANRDDVDGVLVYEDKGTLRVWGDNVEVITDLPVVRIWAIPKISCFYYCGHFMPYVSYQDMRFSELAGMYNASDAWLLVKDVQSYSNIDTLRMDKPLYWHLNLFVAQNNARICNMLANGKIRETIKDYCLPKYVQIGVNQSGYYAFLEKRRIERLLKDKDDKQLKPIPERIVKHKDSKNRLLESFIYYSFLNLAHEGIGLEEDDVFKALIAWQNSKNDTQPVLGQFGSFIKNNRWGRQLSAYMDTVCRVLGRIDELCGFHDNLVTQSFYLDTEEDGDKLDVLAREVIGVDYFLTAKMFDLYYSQDLYLDTILSSGEQNLLDLFSRLYDALVISPQKFANIDSKKLILLDEAEIGFHPDWQRKYINLLIQFLQTMVLVKPGEDFQVVISTHSPILLSDIPNDCVNYLFKDAQGVAKSLDYKVETFATNVFEQYKNSFFMGDGLVGEYARKKLLEIQKGIEDGQVTAEMKRVLAMVGDSRVREYLEQQIAQQNIDSEISFYEEKLKKLREEKERRHE